MSHLSRLAGPACLLLLALAGCTSTKHSTNQDLTVASPVYTAALYPPCHGRTVRIVAHMRPHGSRVEALRVLVSNGDGALASDPPEVRVLGGAPVQTISTDGNAAVIWFGCPSPSDGTCVTLSVTVPSTGPCPYRVRLVPVFKAG